MPPITQTISSIRTNTPVSVSSPSEFVPIPRSLIERNFNDHQQNEYINKAMKHIKSIRPAINEDYFLSGPTYQKLYRINKFLYDNNLANATTNLTKGIYGGGKTKKRKWSLKYKRSINCKKPKGFSQKQYCKRVNKTRRKTNKKMKGRGSSPSKMKFLREIEEELINEELGDSFFRQRSDAADDGSDVGSVDDKKSIPTTTASTPPPSPPIPRRYERVGPSDVKVVKPLDIIPRKLTSHEEVALENGLEYWPYSAGPLEGALPIPVPARAIDQPNFYSLAPITTPHQRQFEHDSSKPITVATDINRRIREEPTGQNGYLQLTPSDLALLQDEIKYAPIRQAEEDQEYARSVQRRQERNFINQDEEYARRVQNELDGNTRRQTRCRGRRCTISGGKRVNKTRRKK